MQRKRRLKPKVKIGILVILCIACLTGVFFWFHSNQDTQNNESVETVATLCIDPGHGGYDSGTIGADGSYEKDINLEIALEVGKEIEKEEPRIKVIYTRDSDKVTWPEDEEEDLKARVKFAQDNNADYYLSIHMNSNEDPSAFGYESYIRENDKTSQAIVENIVKDLDEEGWQYNRGILYVEQYPLYVVSNQSIPSLLFEAGFMSNYQECTELQQSKNQKIIAKAIAKAYIDQILEDKVSK